METFYGLGLICGPTLGGALYEVNILEKIVSSESYEVNMQTKILP